MKKIGIPAAFLLAIGFAGCYTDKMNELYPAAICDTSNVTYNGTIRPLTDQHCAISGCHTGTAPAGTINLSTYSGLQTIAVSGQLHNVINHITNPMPKNTAKLDNCTISKYEKWIAGGAPNN